MSESPVLTFVEEDIKSQLLFCYGTGSHTLQLFTQNW